MVYFIVKIRDQGSAILRGIQISAELEGQGVDSCVITEDEITETEKNSIFIWVKNINLKLVDELSDGIHVYDVVDNYIYGRELVDDVLNNKLVDHVIVNNEFMKDEIDRLTEFSKKDISVIHHHWDPRIKNVRQNNQDELTFGFLGSVASLRHTDNFLHYKTLVHEFPIDFYDTEIGKLVTDHVKTDQKVEVVRDKDAMQNLSIGFNCHLSIRENDSAESNYKTSAKVATASVFNHNIITTREKATTDILSDDYPFILDNTDIDSVRSMFKLVTTDYHAEKTLWKRGLTIMKDVCEKLSIQTITTEYIRLIENVGGTGK